tara:strand:+ start:72 stop:1511 length:1440 start_codon:yes stop_codon:yes gene_type:complete
MNIIIVGGGSSGWITAANIVHEVPFAKVTLIDKEVPTPLGVGEATLLNFDKFLTQNCGFDRNEYLRELDVGVKAGILFPNWGKEDSTVWHPFYFRYYPFVENMDVPMLDAWSNAQDLSIQRLLPLYDVSLLNKVDKAQHSDNAYALHIDCLKLVKYIRKKLQGKINYIDSAVSDFDGNSLTLENGDNLSADLFVDCTGFKSILKKNRDRVDLSDRLYVNTAVATHIQYEDKEKEFYPYVSCPAVDHGWIWKIPLQSSIGSGLVFNRDITSIEEAKQYFCEHWDNRVSPDQLKVIDWTPYYDKNQWDGNVVSIGLSAGFLEPLESTGLALIIEGSSTLVKTIRSGYYSETDIDYFNMWMRWGYEQCIDFVNMHYSLSTIDSPFWNYVRNNYKGSLALETYLKNLRSTEPSIVEGKGFIFGAINWLIWLVQMGYEMSPKPHINHDRMKESLLYCLDREESVIDRGVDIESHIEFCENLGIV